MITLPDASDPLGTAVNARLQEIIDEDLTVVLVILDSPPDLARILAVADGRAQALSQQRRAVHVTNSNMLSAQRRTEIRGPAGDCVAAVYGLAGTIAACLTATQAADRFDVDDAFLQGAQQKAAPSP